MARTSDVNINQDFSDVSGPGPGSNQKVFKNTGKGNIQMGSGGADRPLSPSGVGSVQDSQCPSGTSSSTTKMQKGTVTDVADECGQRRAGVKRDHLPNKDGPQHPQVSGTNKVMPGDRVVIMDHSGGSVILGRRKRSTDHDANEAHAVGTAAGIAAGNAQNRADDAHTRAVNAQGDATTGINLANSANNNANNRIRDASGAVSRAHLTAGIYSTQRNLDQMRTISGSGSSIDAASSNHTHTSGASTDLALWESFNTALDVRQEVRVLREENGSADIASRLDALERLVLELSASLLDRSGYGTGDELRARLKADAEFRHLYMLENDEAYYARWRYEYDPDYREGVESDPYIQGLLEEVADIQTKHSQIGEDDFVVSGQWVAEMLDTHGLALLYPAHVHSVEGA